MRLTLLLCLITLSSNAFAVRKNEVCSGSVAPEERVLAKSLKIVFSVGTEVDDANGPQFPILYKVGLSKPSYSYLASYASDWRTQMTLTSIKGLPVKPLPGIPIGNVSYDLTADFSGTLGAETGEIQTRTHFSLIGPDDWAEFPDAAIALPVETGIEVVYHIKSRQASNYKCEWDEVIVLKAGQVIQQ